MMRCLGPCRRGYNVSVSETSAMSIIYLCSRDQAWFDTDRPTSCQVQLVGNIYCFKFLCVLFYICRCDINTDLHCESKNVPPCIHS